jgi:hypothetical protein
MILSNRNKNARRFFEGKAAGMQNADCGMRNIKSQCAEI